jgi:predicted PurR-regulated permease PerM
LVDFTGLARFHFPIPAMQLSAYQIRVLAWLALAALAWLMLAWLAPVLMPFVVGAVMAYALHPLVERWHARQVPRLVGAALAIALLMLAVVAAALLIVPVVTRQIPLLREQVPLLLDQLNLWLAPWAAKLGLELQIDVAAVRGLLRQMVAGHESDVLGGLLDSLRLGGSALLTLLGNLILTPIVAYYLLLDWSGLVQRALHWVPPRWQPATRSFFDDTDAVLGQYLRGQLLVMGWLALFYTLALAAVGLKLALPIGVFTGLAVFVPYLGFGLGLVLAVLAALLQFQDAASVLWVLLAYGVGQTLESLYLTPRLLGERIGLHPIAVIFALMAFGQALGFVGVLVALPASAVLLVALRRLRAVYLASGLYLHGQPSQEQDATL